MKQEKRKKNQPAEGNEELTHPRQPTGKGRTAVAVIALLLALACLGGGIYFALTQRSAARQAQALAENNSALDGRVAALEDAASAEKNRENVVIQMEPHDLAAYMTDSAFLYNTQFSAVRYESGPQAESVVKLRLPVTVTIYNDSDQTITVSRAALYPWETIFDETPRQESLAQRQYKGFFAEITAGQQAEFSIPPGGSQAVELEAMLRGIYTHPAFAAELHAFFLDYFEDPEHLAPDPANDALITGKGTINGRVNALYTQALAAYCNARNTRFTLTYTIETARGNRFAAACTASF